MNNCWLLSWPVVSDSRRSGFDFLSVRGRHALEDADVIGRSVGDHQAAVTGTFEYKYNLKIGSVGSCGSPRLLAISK